MSFSSLFILVPLFSVNSDGSENVSILQKLTVKNSYDNKGKLYIVLLFSLIYTVMAYYYVYNFKKKLDIVKNSVQTEDSLDNDIASYTLHIRGINKNLSYIEAKKILNSFFEIYFPNIIEIQVIANYDRLMELIDMKYSVESSYNKYKIKNWKNKNGKRERIKSSICCGYDIDGEIYYKHMIKITNNMLNFYRNLNMKRNTGNAFVSFKDPSLVQKILKNKQQIFERAETLNGKVLQVKVKSLYMFILYLNEKLLKKIFFYKKLKNWTLSQAPPPSDIIWENVKYTKKIRILKMIIFTLILFLVCLVMITPKKVKNIINYYLYYIYYIHIKFI